MEKTTTGKLGMQLRFYAALAFGFAAFNQLLLGALLLGFVLLVEKNEWVSRQCMQALFLTMVGYVVSAVQGILATIRTAFGLSAMPATSFGMGGYTYEWDFISLLSVGLAFAELVLSILVLAGAIVALLRVLKAEDAGLPLVSGWAWAAWNKAVPTEPPIPPYAPGAADDDGFAPPNTNEE